VLTQGAVKMPIVNRKKNLKKGILKSEKHLRDRDLRSSSCIPLDPST
jgi:hypothetical protein